MGLAIETIRRLKDRNEAGEPAIQETTIETRRQRIEAETRRQADIRDCIIAFNNRVKIDPELRKTVASTILVHPQRANYASGSRSYSGVVVAKDFVEAALLTEDGIECLRLAPLNFISGGKWQTYEAAEPIPLEEVGMGYVFSQTKFPSAQDVAQKIQALLSDKLK